MRPDDCSPGRPAASYISLSHREACPAFTLKINGTPHEVDVDGDTPLLWVLRDVLGKSGTKFGRGQALFGACTVHVDGAATRSCITTVDSIGESAITTSVRLAARRCDGPEPMGPYPILTAMINRLSVWPIASFRCRAISGSLLCESRHRAAHGTRSIGRN